MTSSSDTEQQRYHWDRGQTYLVEGGKALLYINGGAAIGVMTFVGNGHIRVSCGLTLALVCFALGALLAAGLFLVAYLTELHYGNGPWETGQKVHFWGYFPPVGAAVMFFLGMFAAAISLASTAP